MIVAYLQDAALIVAVGQSGLPATVDRLLVCDNLDNIVHDGMVVDQTSFKNVVGDFWKNNSLDAKDVKLVVRSRRITIQTIDAPLFRKERDLRSYLAREAQVNSRFTEPCVSFVEFEQDKQAKATHVLAAVADKALVERAISSFASIGVDVTAIASPYTAGIALTHALANKDAAGTLLYLSSDPDQLFAVLYKDGRYQYSSEQHLFTDYGSADFGNEMLHAATNIEQFMQSEHIAQRFDGVRLFGLDEPAEQAVRTALAGYDSSVPIETLPASALFGGPGIASVPPELVQRAAYAIGGLATPKDGVELVESYREATGTGMTRSTKNNLLLALRLPAICLAACLVVIIGLNISNLQLNNQVDALRLQTQTPAAMEQLDKYQAAQKADETAAQTAQSADTLTDALAAYPVPGLNLERTIRSCSLGLVTYRTTGYDETSGSYVIEAYANSTGNISKFVQRLMDAGQNTGWFTVDNRGYQDRETSGDSSDGNGRWKLSVVLNLESEAGR